PGKSTTPAVMPATSNVLELLTPSRPPMNAETSSSHSSSVPRLPSPHVDAVQSRLHGPPFGTLKSHASPPLRKPLPHNAFSSVQVLLQPSPGAALPSSHSSSPSILPSPQTPLV